MGGCPCTGGCPCNGGCPCIGGPPGIGGRPCCWGRGRNRSSLCWGGTCPDCGIAWAGGGLGRSEEHTSELQSRFDLVCRLLLEKKKIRTTRVQCHSGRTWE